MNKRFGLLGEKLAHSFSPFIHGYLGNYDYPLYEIPSDKFAPFMEERQFDGINVTIPYKQAVIPYCATLSGEAQRIGSVNTIVKDEKGFLHGYNTDYHGFSAMLKQRCIDPKGKKVLVLGNGGSARTVRAVLFEMNAREIVTVSRHGKSHYENLSQHDDAQIIVNTTPVGMYPDNGSAPLSLVGFKRLTGVADLIYNPMRTNLLLEAERLDIPYANGLTMLVAQAEVASRLFLDCPARLELVETIFHAIVKKMQNIVLIGMPGCGKSTVGQVLAEMSMRPFVDIDKSIEISAGKSIPEIFADDGEEAFRILETRILSSEAKKNGIVIATGGGVVTRPENIDLLKQNSLIVYLKRDLTELGMEGRPLSQVIGIQALAQWRLPLYEAWSDMSIPVGDHPKQTAETIQEAIL